MLQSVIADELSLSQKIVRGGDEVVPRFRVMAPDGEHAVFVTLPDDVGQRERRLQVLRAFMVWKAATGFVHASEMKVPDAIAADPFGLPLQRPLACHSM